MSQWEAALPATLTAPEILECYKGTTTDGQWNADGSLSDAVTISGVTTTATNRITIRAIDRAYMTGQTTVDGFVLNNNTNASLIYLDNDHVDVEGVGFINENTLSSSRGVRFVLPSFAFSGKTHMTVI